MMRVNLMPRCAWRLRVVPAGECWIWVGPYHHTSPARGALGGATLPHGTTYYAGTKQFAHRAAFAWSRNLPDVAVSDVGTICHICDIPGCVRPSHLREGTLSENLKEAYARKRR